MKHFDRDGKYNFVDDNNVFVGYDSGQCCCEQASWMLFDHIPLDPMRDKEVELERAEGFNFDTKFFMDISDRSDFESGGAVLFKLSRPGHESLYLCLYNSHNGYYSHGFQVVHNGIIINSGSL